MAEPDDSLLTQTTDTEPALVVGEIKENRETRCEDTGMEEEAVSDDPTNGEEVRLSETNDEPEQSPVSMQEDRHLVRRTSESDDIEEEEREEESTEQEIAEQYAKIRERIQKSKLYVNVEPHQWPIIYSPDYNISFLGFEKLHPFDSGKWGKVYNLLKKEGMFCDETTVCPLEATEDDLLVAHTKQYISRLKKDISEGFPKWSISVAGITEIPPVALLPNYIVQKKVLRPLRLQTGGSILAAKLAMERGWAINIGGGFHHCSSKQGGGFCAYADITLALRFLFHQGTIKKAMILDLDAHQGNGHERDFMQDKESVYILDVYNRHIYPRDGFAKRGISRKVEVNYFIADEQYMTLVASNLEAALNEFVPDILVYNAGTDSLEGDPLGALSITPQGIIKRDMMVFEFARDRPKPIPIVMVTSGGYQRNNADIIAASILNLWRRGLIACPEAEEYQGKQEPSSSTSRQPEEGETAGETPSTSNADATTQGNRGFFRSFLGFLGR
ncbi:histone deacetylase 11 isoform X1 [Strongylocentrotus purpuratus]|uniref:Histone deacetylase 11 n=1 Tax=Strongylocentrotus purpuratus TaxID=7668 RepID=A0A7M7PLC0_STRPU|nr:histone deacetylase 11 isoform X1 [Strongylocentrotus purpuratus]